MHNQMKAYVLGIVASLGLLGSIPVQAQALANAAKLEEMDLRDVLDLDVTTASKIAERLDDAPGSVTVITRQQIVDSNARTLKDALNLYAPGMDVVPTFFAFGDNVGVGIYSRGILSDFGQQVLILWNGQAKFTDTMCGCSFMSMDFTLENIERIEVSRSPIPMYGGSAIVVINLISREQTFNGAELSTNLSAFDGTNFKLEGLEGKKFTALLGAKKWGWHFGSQVQYYDDTGQPNRAAPTVADYGFDPKTLRDGTKNAVNFSFSADSLDGKWVAQTWYHRVVNDASLVNFVPSQSNDLNTYTGSSWVSNVKYTAINDDANKLEFNGSATTEYWNVVNGGNLHTNPLTVLDENQSTLNTYDLSLEAIYHHWLQLGGKHLFLAGAKLEREGLLQDSGGIWTGVGWVPNTDHPDGYLGPVVSRTVSSVYAEDAYKPVSNLELVAGVRGDYYYGFGLAREVSFNPRFAITYNALPSLVFKGLYASATRPPSSFEQLGPLLGSGPVTYSGRGGGAVRSERVQNYEVSILYKLLGLKAQVTPFLMKFSDKIQAVPLPDGTTQTGNSGIESVYGIDFNTQYYFSRRAYVFGNATFLHTLNSLTSTPSQGVASTYLNGGVNYQWHLLNLNANLSYRSNRYYDPVQFPINTQYARPNLAVNTSASYDLGDNSRIYFSVENLFDRINYVPLFSDSRIVTERGRTYNLGIVWAI